MLFCASPAHALGLSDPFGTEAGLPATPPGSCPAEKDVGKLTLIGAVDVALCNNPDTRMAWANARVAAAGLGQARSAYLPAVTAEGSLDRNFNDGGSRSGSVSADRYTSYGADFTLSYLLFDFGGREARVESAKQQMLRAGWNFSASMQALVFQVVKQYLDVFTATETLDAARLTEEAGKKSFEAAKAKLDVGLVTPADTAQAETAYAQNVLARQQAENTLLLARGSFAALLHLPPSHALELAPVDPDAIGKPLSGDVEELIAKAAAQRPDLAAGRAEEKRARAELNRARTLDYPSLSLAGSSGSTNYTRGSESMRRDDAIGLRLSVPLFTGFSNTYQIEAARHQLEAASEARRLAEDDAALDVWTRYHNYQTGMQTYATAQTLLKSAEASEALAFGRYKEGKGTLLDALDAQARLADARRQWVQARYATLVTRYDLIRALGDSALPELEAAGTQKAPAQPVMPMGVGD